MDVFMHCSGMLASLERGKLAIVQVEKEAGHVFVVNPSPSVGLILRDQLLMRTCEKTTPWARNFTSSEQNGLELNSVDLPLRSIQRWTRSSGRALWWRCPTQQHQMEPKAGAEHEAKYRLEDPTLHELCTVIPLNFSLENMNMGSQFLNSHISQCTFFRPLWMLQFLQETTLLSQCSAAPHVMQRSGSHSLTAR